MNEKNFAELDTNFKSRTIGNQELEFRDGFAAPRGVCEGSPYIGIRHEIRTGEIYILSRPVNGVQKSRFG